MGFYAKVIEDSAAISGPPEFRVHQRLTTLELCYPRFIHSEFMTHRVFSRNAASSRAIPVAKMIEQVKNNPATPVYWGKNQPGMQARVELEGEELQSAKNLWAWAAEDAVDHAFRMNAAGVHKQIVNRILEPWQWMKTIVTATEWDNFFALRCHPDAQPEMQHLAALMFTAYNESQPKRIGPFDWHLPYIRPEERAAATTDPDRLRLVYASSGRCARVSYLNHDGSNPDLDKDVGLYTTLSTAVPPHMSPLEHQAMPDSIVLTNDDRIFRWDNPQLHGNFKGWVQHRKVLEWSKADRAFERIGAQQ